MLAVAYLNIFTVVPTIYIFMFWTQIFSLTLREDTVFLICEENFSIVNMLFICT